MNDENQLLRAYAEEKSEPAFAELVRRYIDLVYSAALRQVNGNSSLAEDVTQSVFLDLARKAGSLTRHSSLAGWLFTTTRFIASNSLRHEMRRHAREQKAEIMIEQESEAAWQELRPVLDEAMHQLAEPDREAVLLRFFERQPLGAIGQRWGITENAARMRVERAIEKLRNALQKRGVTATALSLDGLLTARGTTAAPVGLTAKITAMRPGRHAALQPITTFRAARFGRVRGPAAGVLVCLVFTRWFAGSFQDRSSVSRQNQAQLGAGTSPGQMGSVPAPAESNSLAFFRSSSLPEPEPTPGAGSFIEISTVSADTEQPIPNVVFDVITRAPEKWNQTKIIGSSLGVTRIGYPVDASELDICTQTEGLADTRLIWRPDRGDKIPERYTLRLTRPVPISGTVLDADGAPVSGAKVSFFANTEAVKTLESRAYRWTEAETDSAGHWQIDRIAPEMLARSAGRANHPERWISSTLTLREYPEEIRNLTNGTFVFHLGRTVAVKGIVLNEAGQAIPGAQVASDFLGGSLRHEVASGPDGRFLIANAAPGPSYLSAQAEGYAPASLRVEIEDTDGPYTLRLDRGKTLRFRVIDTDQRPISGAHVSYEPFGSAPIMEPQPAQIMFDHVMVTDAEGRAAWTNVPDALLSFAASASGYMFVSRVLVRPSDQETIITLDYALKISGAVHDSSGRPVPSYRISIRRARICFRLGQARSGVASD
ncbi:MAG TPA: sigma-70 family RNA polymerase sigma factor [Verrucomicrobiae bacterium]|nr:sigma-70 family RNA polymerase sigma factor [Verrucomicrobiae bacterium]